MESRFHRELEDLKATILDMAALSLKAMEKSLRALFDRNEQLAEEVIEKDQEVNLLEVQVDRLILKLLALAQPKLNETLTPISQRPARNVTRRFAENEPVSGFLSWEGKAGMRLRPVH